LAVEKYRVAGDIHRRQFLCSIKIHSKSTRIKQETQGKSLCFSIVFRDTLTGGEKQKYFNTLSRGNEKG